MDSRVELPVPDEAIAIVGIALRLPGGLNDEAALWQALLEGRDLVTEVPADRWAVDELRHARRAEAGRSLTFAAGVVEIPRAFDAAFFGISPREAAVLDPQQRMMLELAWEALESAGVRPSTLAGSNASVHVGLSSLDNGMRGLDDLANMTAHAMTGNTLSLVANRVSWFLDLHGPSLAIDTACSSSLVALHQACTLLRAGEVPSALVGGVNLLLHPYSFVGFTKAAMLSPRGRCRAFDAAGDGYVRAEGGVMLYLKRARDALIAGDRIHALLLASGVNTDGARKTGLTIPSVDAQAELMNAVLARAGLAPQDLDFVEAHGTGTPVGDPVEAAALGRVHAQRTAPLPIGSVKTNFGHLEPVSGLAGLLKATLALKHGVLPASLHFDAPNPHIDFAASKLRVVDTPLPLDATRPLRAGVNSFGFGGANAHVILQQAPRAAACDAPAVPALVLSAASEAGLRRLAGDYARRLEAMPIESVRDVASAAWWRRERFAHRLAVVPETAAHTLAAFARGEEAPGAIVERAPPGSAVRSAFVYSGNGAQWPGMGRRLWHESAAFRRHFEEVDAALRAHAGFSPIEELHAEPDRLDDTAIAQPMLFALQVALTGVLRERGLVPHATMGHSVGEIAAAWACGALDLDAAAHLVAARSRAQAATRGSGRMAAVAWTEATARERIAALGGDLALAAVNSPRHVTLSGAPEDLARAQAQVEAEGGFFRDLGLDYAFHSRHMDAIAAPLAQALAGLAPRDAADAVFVSSVGGEAMPANGLDADYWWRNVREPVQFARATAALAAQGCNVFVEIGPHAVLQRYLGDTLGGGSRVLATLRRDDDGAARLEETSLRLHALQEPGPMPPGVPCIDLPAYPWQRELHWQAPTPESHRLTERRRVHPLLGWRLTEAPASWENTLDPVVLPWLAGHRVGGSVLLPATAHVELALAAAREHFGGQRLACENLDIHAPMPFEPEVSRLLRLELSPGDGRFTITSRRRLSNDAWTLHASGRVFESPARGTVSIAEVESGALLDTHELCALAARLGVELDGEFRAMRRVQVAGDFAQTRLAACEGSGLLLHPAVLDGGLQSMLAFFRDEIVAGEARAMLPVRIARIERFADAAIATCRTRLRRRSARSLLADFEFLDEGGGLVARLSGCRMRAVPLQARANAPGARWQLIARELPLPYRQREGALRDFDLASALRAALPDTPERRTWFAETLPLLEALAPALLREIVPPQRAHDEPASLRWARARVRDACASDVDARGTGARGADAQGAHAPSADAPNADAPRTDAQSTDATSTDSPSADALLQALWQESPASAPMLAQMAGAASLLPRVWASESAAPASPSPLAERRECEDPAYRAIAAAVAQGLRAARAALPPGRRLRLLAIGAGALPPLPDDEACDVVVASLGAEAAPTPNATLARLDRDSWRLAAERPLPEAYDVVLLFHSVHRAAHPQAALAQAAQWLAPGATLLLAERHPDWSADLVAGVDPAWWQGEAAGEPRSALLAPLAWGTLLEGLGYEAVETIVEPAAADFAAGAYLVLARHAGEVAPQLTTPGECWHLLTETRSHALALKLGAQLRAAGHAVRFDGEFTATDGHVVDLRGIRRESGAEALDTLRTLAALSPAPRFWRIGHGGAPFEVAGAARPDPREGALWSLLRVAANEYPALGVRCIDAARDVDPARLAEELLHPDGTDEIVLTATARYAPRLLAAPNAQTLPERFRLDFDTPGRLPHVTWRAAVARAPAAGEIEVRVRAAGLNFRDVMYALGLLPEEAVEEGFAGATLGLEFAGVVERVGEGVDAWKPGDAVFGFGGGCLASHVTTRADAVAALPPGWGFEAAAGVPVAFLTAWYALHDLARLQPGERVLLHGAAGGVGLAALQIARLLGAEVIATAGTEDKRALLRRLGARAVFDSRSLAFADEVLAVTGGEGVDVVLNSLAGEAQRRSFALLRPFGRFLELGKRDFFADTPLGQRPFKDNAAFHGIDADRLLLDRPAWAARAFAQVQERFARAELQALPCRVFAPNDVVAALRAMQQSRHLGKLVVAMEPAPRIAAAAPAPWRAAADECWLVTGGLGGFGLESARWLAARGVRHLLLLGRRGGATPGAAEAIAELRAQGVQVEASACDVADARALRETLKFAAQVLPPITGLLHAAMTIDDGLLADLDAARLDRVLRAKMLGAWNLHRASRRLPLRQFVLYSSVTTLFGSPGQGSYVAANGGLEALARLRRRRGLPATCIAWGPIADAGFLARNEALRDGASRRLGAAALTAAAALERLGEALARGDAQVAIADFDWPVLSRLLPAAASTRFDALELERGRAGATEPGADSAHRLLELPPQEAMAQAVAMVRDEAGRILGLDAVRVDTAQPLREAGMDSLMAVELAHALEQRFGTAFPLMALHEAPTVERLAAALLDALRAPAAEPGDALGRRVAEFARQHGETLAAPQLAQLTEATRRLRGDEAPA